MGPAPAALDDLAVSVLEGLEPRSALGPRRRRRVRLADPVRISFLGGLGEIGRNCACIETQGRIVVLDCGIMFPDPDMPGIDLVLPDFTTYLGARQRGARVEALAG